MQRERRDQYSYNRQDSTASANSIGPPVDSPLYHPERRHTRDVNSPQTTLGVGGGGSSSSNNPYNMSSSGSMPPPPPPSDTVIDFGGSFANQMLVEGPNQNSAYLEARDQTIESIESTIAELGQVYTRYLFFTLFITLFYF